MPPDQDTDVVDLIENDVVLDGETPPVAVSDDPDDETVISIEGETPPDAESDDQAPAPQWVKDLRKTNRELARENRELKQSQAVKQVDQVIEALKKPTLADCDFDEDDFEKKLSAYHAQQTKIAEEKRNKEATQKAQEDAWKSRINAHEKSKTELKVSDYDDAEEVVKNLLSVTQQAIIIQAAQNSAALIYAIGKSETQSKRLAALTDPVAFAFAVSKLEDKLTISTKKSPPPPERSIGGSAPGSAGVDSNLEKLRAEAAKTGDHSKVMAYKRDLKAKQAK